MKMFIGVSSFFIFDAIQIHQMSHHHNTSTDLRNSVKKKSFLPLPLLLSVAFLRRLDIALTVDGILVASYWLGS